MPCDQPGLERLAAPLGFGLVPATAMAVRGNWKVRWRGE
jgi:hypothetical protein